jgi:hypothetical protein
MSFAECRVNAKFISISSQFMRDVSLHDIYTKLQREIASFECYKFYQITGVYQSARPLATPDQDFRSFLQYLQANLRIIN